MIDRKFILKAIYDAIDELNLQRPTEEAIAKLEETRLYGEGASLDSLGLVTLIVEAESFINDQFHCNITIADDRAFSEKNSPFLSVGSLADYITKLLNEESE